MNGHIRIDSRQKDGDGSIRLSSSLQSGRRTWKQRLIVRGVEEGGQLDNTGDVWAVLYLHKMMELGGDFHLHGRISASLLEGISRYAAAWVRLQPHRYHPIRLVPDRVEDDRFRERKPAALACFSGGLDACFTAYRHARGLAGAQGQQLEACLMVRGADIRLDRQEEWEGAEASARALVVDLGIPHFYTVETNFREMHCAYGMAYFSMLAACMRLFGRQYGRLMLGSDDPVHYFTYPWGNNPVTNHFLSSHGCEIITDGLEFSRTEKAAVVAQWPLALQKLRCCYSGRDLSGNCGRCAKCRRTRLNFMAVGVMDLPCMPPLEPGEEVLDRDISQGERQELSLLVEYRDAHPEYPMPLWEQKLREKLGMPLPRQDVPQGVWNRLVRRRKILSGHVKLWRARKQIDHLWQSTWNSQSKSLPEVRRELHELVASGQAFPVRSLIPSYFLFRLHRQGADRHPFVFESEWLHDFVLLNQAAGEEYHILENKESAWKTLQGQGIPMPRRWGTLIAEKGRLLVRQAGGKSCPLQELMNQVPTLFAKPADGMKGQGCQKLKKDGECGVLVNGERFSWEQLAARLDRPLLLEDDVVQHPGNEELHPGSLNTLRLVTMRMPGGSCRVVCGMQRMGVGAMHLDNLSSGGLAVGVRPSGHLKEWAYSADPCHEPYLAHPDSGIVFAGRAIPFYREAEEMVCRAHALFSRIHSVGWDVALTPTGPLLIESNCSWGMLNIQIIDGGLRTVLENYVRPAARELAHPSPFKRAHV